MPSFSYCHRHHLDLLSFPTRRSSDLLGDSALEGNPDAQDLSADYEFEPDADTLLAALLPQYVSRILFSMFLEASASESAARRTAMKAATDNANRSEERRVGKESMTKV